MGVYSLLVEGKLDVEILFPVLGGKPIVEMGGSKYGLKAQAERLSTEHRQYRYVRDRDFDYNPPENCTAPVPDRGGSFGWHWCRHSIESYLLDPAVVCAAIGVDRNEYENALRRAATSIRYYEAARWSVGVARRSLPPIRDLETRPRGWGKGDFLLAPDLSEAGSKEWVIEHTGAFLEKVTEKLNGPSVEQGFTQFCARFEEAFCEDASHVLTWFSGKDLFGALGGWFSDSGHTGPGAVRTRIRDWCRSNPEGVLDLIPEWKNFVEILRAEADSAHAPG